MEKQFELKEELFKIPKLDLKSLPKTYDKKTIGRLAEHHKREIQGYINSNKEYVVSDLELMDGLTGALHQEMDKKQQAQLSATVKKNIAAFSRMKPKEIEAEQGHNPTFFAPFINMGSNGMIGGVQETVRFRNTPSMGVISISVAAYMPGGHVSRFASQGTISINPSNQNIEVSALVTRAGNISAISLVGYARASASIVTSVTVGQGSRMETRHREDSIADIYFGIHRPQPVFVTTNLSIPSLAGDMVLTSVGLRVTAGCGGLICASTANVAIAIHRIRVSP